MEIDPDRQLVVTCNSAEEFDPGDPYIRANLRFARDQVANFTAPILLGLAALCFIICLSLDASQRLFQKSAIVIVSEAVARRGPLEEAQSAFTLHDGAELLIVNNDGPWVEVASASARTGWIPQKDLAFVP